MNGQVFYVPNGTDESSSIDNLAVGKLGIYAMDSQDGVMINATPAVKSDFFQLALGKLSGGTFNSRVFEKPKARNFEMRKFVYKAPVNEVINVTFSCLGKSSGDEYFVNARVTSAFQEHGIDSFVKTFSVVGKFDTAIALYTALANKINEEANGIVESATATEGGLQVKAKLGVNTAIGIDYIPYEGTPENCKDCCTCEGTVEVLVRGDLGSGTAEQIRKVIADWQIWTGRGYLGNPLFTKTPATDFVIPDNIKATTYYIKWSNTDQPDESNTAAAFNVYQEVMVVFPESVPTTYFEQTTEALLKSTYQVVNY